MAMAVPAESAQVGHDGFPGQFCRRSGLELKVQVHARRERIVQLFTQYDRGNLTTAQLSDALRSSGVHLTAAYHHAMKKPPLTLARLLHVLTLPDGDRYDAGLVAAPPVTARPPVSFDHSRQYAVFGDRWDAENVRLRANTAPVSRDAVQCLFKDLHRGVTTAADVTHALVNLGIEVGPRRQRLLVNCERGSENGFRELVVEFQEPFLARDDLPPECHSEGARRAIHDAQSRSRPPVSPKRAATARRAAHRSELCTPDLTVWDRGADPGLSDWERRNLELVDLKHVHVERTTRSHVAYQGALVPTVLEPEPKPLRTRSVPDDPLLATMTFSPDRPDLMPKMPAPLAMRTPAPTPLLPPSSLLRPSLICPWGNSKDLVNTTAERVSRPLSVKAQRYLAMSLKCCQEMADLDRPIHG